jgi:hypothetical protein
MRTISAIYIAALSGALAGPPAFGQAATGPYSTDDAAHSRFDNIETEFRFDAGVVVLFDADDRVDESVLFDVSAGFDLEVLTDDGRRWGVVTTLRGERDSGRRAWGGRVGDCAPGQADCPVLMVAGQPHPVQSPVSGLRTTGPVADEGTRFAVEEAYAYLHTGWGELRAGYGAGAADVDAEKGPTAFRLSRADGGRVDLSGLSGARTRNGTSGRALKLLFRSIPLGQVSTIGVGRVLASYTPAVRDCGVDLCAREYGPAGMLSPVFNDVVEVALRYEIHRGESEFAASLGHSWGQDATGRPGFQSIQTADFGLSWRNGPWQAGARWLRSNSGVVASGDYEAWSVSVGVESGSWLTTFEYADFSDDLAHSDGATAQLSASRLLGDRWVMGGGVQASRREEPVLTTIGRQSIALEDTRLFAEVGWQF